MRFGNTNKSLIKRKQKQGKYLRASISPSRWLQQGLKPTTWRNIGSSFSLIFEKLKKKFAVLKNHTQLGNARVKRSLRDLRIKCSPTQAAWHWHLRSNSKAKVASSGEFKSRKSGIDIFHGNFTVVHWSSGAWSKQKSRWKRQVIKLKVEWAK